MTKKKRNLIIISSVTILIVLIIAILVFLYITTDLFKSNKVLFGKYLAQAAQNVEGLLKDNNEEYNNLLENNKYISNTDVSVKYIKGIGTTDENTSNVINNLKLNINGKTDIQSNINYQKILLQKNTEDVAQIEYLKSGNDYGIRFSDLFKQYLAVEGQEMQNLLERIVPNIMVTQNTENIENIDLKNLITFSDEDLKIINATYANIVSKKFEKSKFSKNKKASITVKNETIETNAYALIITKEQLNEIYIDLLEQVKNDEIILKKLEEIENLINPSNTSEETEELNIDEETEELNFDEETEEQTIKEKLTTEIDTIITNIKNKNIGDDECKITVYESKGYTVRTVIETTEYKIVLDTLSNGNDIYVRYYQETFGTSEDSNEITVEKNENKFNLVCKIKKGEEEYTTELAKNQTIINGTKEANTTISYDIGTNKIEFTIDTKKEIVNSFNEIYEFNKDNSIFLNTLTDEQLNNNIMDVVNDRIIEKTQIISEQINFEELFNILKELNFLSDQVTISDRGLTKSEVSKFNSEFEIYKGQEVQVDAIQNLLKIVQNNLDTVEVLSENVIKLNIVKGTKNEELAAKVSEIVGNEKNKSKKYSIQYEYDEESKIIKDIIIEILEKK